MFRGGRTEHRIPAQQQAVDVRCNFLRDLDSILTDRFPATDDRLEGQLVYLQNYGLTKLQRPTLQQATGLDFYKARFFTGYRKFSTIDVVIGLNVSNNQIGLLTNPVFSDKYSDLLPYLEKIQEADINQQLINDIIELYKDAGTIITEIDTNNNLYQIWFGDGKWRMLKIGKSPSLTIKNYT